MLEEVVISSPPYREGRFVEPNTSAVGVRQIQDLRHGLSQLKWALEKLHAYCAS